MSEFFIQEQQLGTTTRTVVKDEQGRSLFLMVGRWGSRGDALSLYAMNGELLASIKQVSLTFGARFELYSGFKKVGTMRKLLNLNADFYYIQRLHWTVLGDIRDHRYAIYHVNHKVMTLDKATLVSGNYYVLDVADDQEAPLCICIAAVLDYWLYNKKKSKQRSLKLDLNGC